MQKCPNLQKCPNFIGNFLFRLFCQIFAMLFAKTWRGLGSDKYEVWCVEQFEKNAQNSIFVRPFMEQISFTICIIKQIFGKVFISHIQLVLKIFVTSCPFSDWIATGSFVNLQACGPAFNSHPNMTHSQMLGKVEYGLPAKIWRLVGCTEMLSW